MGDLLNVNVWLAFSAEGHAQHKAALYQWSELNRPTFCRVTVLGLMRLLCNPAVMGAHAFPPRVAWNRYEQLIGSGTVEYAEEPAGLDIHLKALTAGAKASRDSWTDAYLAAFAQAAGMRLVSFDSGFAKTKNLNCLILSPQS